jgi:hypothetical protein
MPGSTASGVPRRRPDHDRTVSAPLFSELQNDGFGSRRPAFRRTTCAAGRNDDGPDPDTPDWSRTREIWTQALLGGGKNRAASGGQPGRRPSLGCPRCGDRGASAERRGARGAHAFPRLRSTTERRRFPHRPRKATGTKATRKVVTALPESGEVSREEARSSGATWNGAPVHLVGQIRHAS